MLRNRWLIGLFYLPGVSKKRLHKWTTYRFRVWLTAIHTPAGRVLLPEGLSHGLKTVHRTVLPSLRSGRPFESRPGYQKSGCPNGQPLFWYTGRDSNPQPSEPESDALSIEPPVHLLDSLNIIAVFSPFVKPKTKNFSVKHRYSSQITVDFCYGYAIISVNIAY